VVNAGYVDIYRHLNPTKIDVYSYWDTFTHARERNVGWRIDYFFVSQELQKRVKKAEIHADIFGSDHCPVSITL
jgi:exodeoxyribonuclease-3